MRRSVPFAIPKYLVALVIAILGYLPAHAARLALVIGNRDYSIGALTNPINDAVAMGAALDKLGFKVTTVRNLKRDDIGRTIEGFASRVRTGDDVVVFYAGHGMQVKGVNYLPAVDANIRVESDVALNSLNLNELLDRLDGAKAGVRLLLIDACRDNPYSRGFRSGTRGLARVESAPSGTLMHFATRPGGVASDGIGGNGLYTTELLKHLRTPGLPVESMLKRVAAGVRQASGGQQQPWTEGALEGEFYFAQGGTVPAPAPPTPALGKLDSSTPEPIAVSHPIAQPAMPTNIKGQTIKDCDVCPLLVVVPAGIFIMGSDAMEQALASKGGVAPSFMSRDSPPHQVSVRSFAASRYAVTRGEFAAFVHATGYETEAEEGEGCQGWTGSESKTVNAFNWRNLGFAQADDHPVVCVSWNDTQSYIRWLNQTSGMPYRLLSEAEREYATRAGSQSAFWWGDTINTEQANYYGTGNTYNNSPKGEWRKTTVPVGSFQANPFGLYNVHGNAWEWVEDCSHDDYSGAPSDGTAWTTGCVRNLRVIRGGSWFTSPAGLRSAHRNVASPIRRNDELGFRIARNLQIP